MRSLCLQSSRWKGFDGRGGTGEERVDCPEKTDSERRGGASRGRMAMQEQRSPRFFLLFPFHTHFFFRQHTHVRPYVCLVVTGGPSSRV